MAVCDKLKLELKQNNVNSLGAHGGSYLHKGGPTRYCKLCGDWHRERDIKDLLVNQKEKAKHNGKRLSLQKSMC
jgi:hypothetical protein